MKFVLMTVLISLFLVSVAVAETPKAEVFGGYQYLRVNVSDSDISQGFNFNGWNASLTGNVNKWLGVTADFSGSYHSESVPDVGSASIHVYTYTFGPVVSLNREGKINPFVHALFGGAHVGASAEAAELGSISGGTNGFAMMMGGGVDANVSDHFALRAVQVDWVYYHIEGTSQSKNVRISTGIVFRF